MVQGKGDQHHPAPDTAVQSCTPAFHKVSEAIITNTWEEKVVTELLQWRETETF